MRRFLAALLALAMLCLAIGACAEQTAESAFLGTWTADGVTVEIALEGEQIQCRAEFRIDEGERERWEYCACWYDEAANALACGGIVRTRERYSALFDEWSETDWSTNDMSFAQFTLSEEGDALLWTDDNMEEPLLLQRSDP